MPLTSELESLIKELEKADPAAAKAQRELLEKHEALQKTIQGGVLRQSDYDRKMNEVKGKVDKYDETMDWYNKNKPKHDQLLTDYNALQFKAAQLEADLKLKTAAAASTNNDDPNNPKIDADKLAAAVRERIGSDYASKAEMSRIVAEESVKASEEARKQFFEVTFPQSALWISGLVDAQFAYRDEFGKSLPRDEFAKFLKENQIVDPMKGYEKFVETLRTEKKITEETEKRVNEELRKRGNVAEFPGSSGSPQPMGALQVRLAKREEGDPLIPKDAELGDGSLAALAAADLRKGAGAA